MILVNTKIQRSDITLNKSLHILGEIIYNAHISSVKASTYVLSFIQGADPGKYF